MLFNSLQFALFLPIAVIVYFALPQRLRWCWLLATSAYFYMCFVPRYILILAVTILIDYVAGLLIEASPTHHRKKVWLVVSVVANVSMLGYFKYAGFVVRTAHGLASVMGIPSAEPVVDVLLPIGLSFHTFQSMSYTIEVYRGRQAAERHLGRFAVYVLFFPQLVAGPIERPQNVLPQLAEAHRFDYESAVAGLQLMAWGFIKKVVIADRLALLVQPAFSAPRASTGVALALATVFFSYQIYCDFSGYSDIALGSAQLFGVSLMRNFDHPYSSRSLAEFWRRWHISLSTWFRDYVYLPLGGSRSSRAITYRNILVIFLISGLWHGANWTYVVWGALHGGMMVALHSTSRIRGGLSRLLHLDSVPGLRGAGALAATFSWVCFAWVFFRAASVGDALFISWAVLRSLPQLVHPTMIMEGASALTGLTGLGRPALAIAFASIASLELIQWHQRRHGSLRRALRSRPTWVRWGAYTAIAGVFLLFAQTTQPSSFIYFQF